MLEVTGKGRTLKLAKSLATHTGCAAKGCPGKKEIGRWRVDIVREMIPTVTEVPRRIFTLKR